MKIRLRGDRLWISWVCCRSAFKRKVHAHRFRISSKIHKPTDSHSFRLLQDYGQSKINWKYIREPDPGLNKRTIRRPRSKVLGGSSSINGLLFVRGQSQDYNLGSQLRNVGWAWKDVLPIFKMLGRWYRASGSEDALKGSNGPMAASPNALQRDIADYWI